MKILVIGAGAVGGYFGGRLAEAGRDVSFLVRAKHADRIRKQGLRIVSPQGDVTVHPKVTVSDEIDEHFDLILLSVKTCGLEAAIDDFSAAVGPNTMIFPMLNGMRHLDLLVSRFGAAPVIGGVCLCATDLDSNGSVVQLTAVQKLTYGELRGGARSG